MPKSVIVGLWLGENSAATVFVDGVLAGAAKQAWIDRVPDSGAFPSGALDAALDVAGARPAEISSVEYAGLVGDSDAAPRGLGRMLLKVASVIRSENIRSSPGIRGVRVETASKPRGVQSVADLRRRCREARLPDVPLTEVKLSQLSGILDSLAPELRRAVSGTGGMAAAAGLAAGGKLPSGTAHWGPSFGGQDAYRALSFALLDRERVENPVETAERFVGEGKWVAFAGGAMSFDPTDCSTRCWMWLGNSGIERRPLLAPDGVIACTAGEAVRAYQARIGVPAEAKTELIVGPYLAR